MKIFVKEKKLSLNKPVHHSLVEVNRHLASVILQLQAQRGPTFLRDESILPLIMALSSLPWYHHHYLSNHSGRAPLTRWKLSNFSFDLSRLNLQPRRNCFRICKVVISTRQHGKHRWEEEMVNCHYHSFWWMMCQNQNLVIPPDVPQVRALVDPLPKVCHAGRHLRFWFHFLDCMWRLVGQRQAKLNQIRFVRYSAKNSRLRFWFSSHSLCETILGRYETKTNLFFSLSKVPGSRISQFLLTPNVWRAQLLLLESSSSSLSICFSIANNE